MYVDSRKESWESRGWFTNWCELGIFILFPAALIICGVEKYNRWEGWDHGVTHASARRWFQTDTGLATSMTIGAVLAVLAWATIALAAKTSAEGFRDWWKR